MILTVVKRDGRVVGFNEEKIQAAIRKAMIHTEKGEDEQLVARISTVSLHAARSRWAWKRSRTR